MNTTQTTTMPQSPTSNHVSSHTPSQQPSNTPQDPKQAYDPQYAIYKPNGRGSGAVARFGLSVIKSCVFLEVANQSGERQFDWDGKIIMKWGISDLGAILAVLQRRTPEAKLFHRTEKADTSLTLLRQQEADRAPYLLSISKKLTSDGSSKRMSIPITDAEAAILETILRSGISRILRW